MDSLESKKRRIMIITADESIIEQIQNTNNTSLIKSFLVDSNDPKLEMSPTKRKKIGTLTCVICGSAANGYNFDAITCESCKAFFRRNALKDRSTLECRRQGTCDITVESRRRCSACRLSKCLESGMKSDRLLTTEQKEARRRQIEENRSLTSALKQQSNSNSPVVEKPFSPPSATPLNPPSVPQDRNLLLLNDVADLLPSSNDNEEKLLTSEDLERVQTIQLSYEQRIELAAREGLPWNPTTHADTLLQHLNARSVSVMRLISFFKQIPEFNELNVSDRVTLVKYNLMPLVILNCTLFFKIGAEEFKESATDAPWNSTIMQTIHGQELYLKVKKIFESFVRLAQYDPRIIQLGLIILILTKGFSTSSSASEPILNDELAVYRAQDHFTELLWKYLETVYGRIKAIQIFNDLVAHFISWQMLQEQLHKSLHSKLTSTEINDLLPIMRSLLHIP